MPETLGGNESHSDSWLDVPTNVPARPEPDSIVDQTLNYDLSSPHSAPSNIPARIQHYEIRSVLGAGGMGTVYRAFDTMLGREVAIKVTHGWRDQRPDSRARFLREARLSAQLKHPNLCPIYEIGDNDGQLYIAMEFLEGRTLSEVTRGQLMTPNQAAQIGIELFSVLAYLESRVVIHRDIKPSNIMLGSSGHLTLMDLGLARVAEEREDSFATQSGEILGTPAFMSPEQARGEVRLTPATDRYLAGASLYSILAGRPPVNGRNAFEMLTNLVNRGPDPIRSVNSGIPKPLARLIDALLSRNPADRPSCEHAIAVLRQFHRPGLEPALGTSYGRRESTDVPPQAIARMHGEAGPASLIMALFTAVSGMVINLLSLFSKRRSADAKSLQSETRPTEAVSTLSVADQPLVTFESAARRLRDIPDVELVDRLPKAHGLARAGHFLLEQRLGAKSAIDVFQARHQLTRQPCIVRLYPMAFGQVDPQRLERLLHQAGQLITLATKSNPLVALRDVGAEPLADAPDSNAYFAVEEFVVGTTVETLIHKECLAEKKLRQFLRRAAIGLVILHERHWLHGNFHAGKVWIESGTDQVRLGDLSLARSFKPGETPAKILSSFDNIDWLGRRGIDRLQYQAPEVLCEDEANSPAAEQYALGVMTLEWATGELIRGDQNLLKMMNRVTNEVRSRVNHVKQQSPRLAFILRKMTEHAPQDRFDSLREVIEELTPKSKPTAAPPTASPTPVLVPAEKPPPPRPKESKERYDVFISYRRTTGDLIARLLLHRFALEGKKAFLDLEGLDTTMGPFPQLLLDTIAATPCFVPILSEDCFDPARCANPNDWFRREIVLALVTNRYIVPVLLPEYRAPDLELLPEDLRRIVDWDGVPYNHDYFEAFFRKLMTKLFNPH